MKKLTIKTVTLRDDYDSRDKDEFYIDGEKIGEGYYGGEPEDNLRYRDYAWVPEIIEKIAKRLGADVETEQVQATEEDFY